MVECMEQIIVHVISLDLKNRSVVLKLILLCETNLFFLKIKEVSYVVKKSLSFFHSILLCFLIIYWKRNEKQQRRKHFVFKSADGSATRTQIPEQRTARVIIGTDFTFTSHSLQRFHFTDFHLL